MVDTVSKCMCSSIFVYFISWNIYFQDICHLVFLSQSNSRVMYSVWAIIKRNRPSVASVFTFGYVKLSPSIPGQAETSCNECSHTVVIVHTNITVLFCSVRNFPQWLATICQATHWSLRRRREVIRLVNGKSDRWSQHCLRLCLYDVELGN